MDGFDGVILEVFNLKGLSVLESPRLFIACLADLSGAQWQRENALMARNCDQQFLACFTDSKIEDESSALFARANAITILRDDYGLAEARVVELSDFLARAVCAYKAISFSSPPVLTQDSFGASAASAPEVQDTSSTTVDVAGEANRTNSVSIGDIRLSASDISASVDKEREEKRPLKNRLCLRRTSLWSN